MSTSMTPVDSIPEEFTFDRTAFLDIINRNEDYESIPTLSSLLLSTAEALANPSRSNQRKLEGISTPGFVLPVTPASLLADPNSTSYLDTLLSLPLTTLLSLPSSLSTLSTSLDTDLSSLAFTRYSAFLLSHAASQSISSSFDTLSTSLSSLLDSTSALESAASEFESQITDIRKKRERMAGVRERMEEVEELLEAPGVVDACVRAGYWAEAIDVAVRLAELHSRLSTASSGGKDSDSRGALVLLDKVRGEVSIALLSLRARVLESLLKQGLKLPGAVRGVGTLRRMSDGGLGLEEEDIPERDLMGEEALRIVFLAARWRCLRAELESVEGQMTASGIRLEVSSKAGEVATSEDDSPIGTEENEERTRWTKRWIEVWREVVGETVGMYSEVFLQASVLEDEASSSTTDPLRIAIAPLTLFLSSALTSLSSILACAIPALTSPSSLSSLLTQLSYCSHAFARYGFEFREIETIREAVEARVGQVVISEWQSAGKKWAKELRAGMEVASQPRQTAKGARPLEDWLVRSESLSSLLSTPIPSLDTQWHHQPPPELSLLPPIARFLNAHATALNSLRLLPATSLYRSLMAAQSSVLDSATAELSAFVETFLSRQQEQTSLVGSNADELSPEELRREGRKRDEKKIVAFTVLAFGRWVLPWCEGGLKEGVYGELNAQDGEKKALSEGEDGKSTLRRQGLEKLWNRIEGRAELEETMEEIPVTEEVDVEASTLPAEGEMVQKGEPTEEAVAVENGDLLMSEIAT